MIRAIVFDCFRVLAEDYANVPDDKLFVVIKALKPKYKIGLLSNSAGNWLPRIFTREQLELFDAVALSYEIGYYKPQPEAYAAIAKRLGVPTGQCLMVDDDPRRCEGARAAGMAALEYQDAAQFERDLPGVITSAGT